MKVTCISCHKKFDNDKYYGICPKCGAFNKLHLGVDEHERYHQMYDDDKNAHSEQAVHEQYHERYDNTTSHAKVSTAGMEGSFQGFYRNRILHLLLQKKQVLYLLHRYPSRKQRY